MSIKTYPVELPESAFSALRKPPAEFVLEMKYAAVVKWYEAGMISPDKDAEIAAMRDHLLETYGGCIEKIKETLRKVEEWERAQIIHIEGIPLAACKDIRRFLKEYGV